ncbi:MAG: filamentous hemagglutinin N-terminal domain-containing protein [Cyanobacteria bacterium P01_F01_bin.56]
MTPQPDCKSGTAICRAGLTILVTAGFMLGGSASAVAQTVTSDGTTGTVVNGAGPFVITGGNQQLQTLFHSFGEFSPGNASVLFQLDGVQSAVELVVGRVTGANASFINGQLQLTGGNSPDLFLMNPNGISFGPDAQLLLPSSFLATTAESLLFDDGLEFSATNPEVAPTLLTINTPLGLQMGGNSGTITVQGTGHIMTEAMTESTSLNRTGNPSGLQVGNNYTLALIGGDVSFTGGVASVNSGGHLEIGSVRGGQVRLNAVGQGWVGDYSESAQFGDIRLVQQSLLDASGSNGSIQLQGRNINFVEGSGALIQPFGAQSAGGITVNATGAVTLSGNTTDGRLGSFITTENLGIGQIGDITVSAAQLSLQNGAWISSRTLTSANSSDIAINVSDTTYLEGFAPASGQSSSIATLATFGTGSAGDITISTGNLRLLNAGFVNSVTLTTGQTGNIQINTTDLIEISGNNPFTFSPSGVSTVTIGPGNAQDTLVNTDRLIVQNGGFLGSNTLSTGAAGSVTVNASDSVEVRGRAAGSILVSRIASASEIIDTTTQAIFGLPAVPNGSSGSVTINTSVLEVADGATITTRNDGPGTAGDVRVNADSTFLNTQGSLSAIAASGEGGNIQVQGNALVLRNNSLISATAGGTGDGGNVNLNVPVIAGFENSDVVANARLGNGGNINITTQGIFGLEFRETLTPGNDITASSQFGVNGTVTVDSPEIDPDSGIVELPSELVDASDQIVAGCADTNENSFVATGRGGMPPTPEDALNNPIWHDVRDLSAFAEQGETVATPPVSAAGDDKVTEITGWLVNEAGEVELVAATTEGAVAIAYGTCASADS